MTVLGGTVGYKLLNKTKGTAHGTELEETWHNLPCHMGSLSFQDKDSIERVERTPICLARKVASKDCPGMKGGL